MEKLADDPSDLVRFGHVLPCCGSIVPSIQRHSLACSSQPADGRARLRLGNFLESNYGRLGRSYGVLLPGGENISEENMPKLLSHFGMEDEKAFTSFAALTQLAPSTNTPAAADIFIDAPATVGNAAPQGEFRVIFFFKPGCRDCDRVRDMLQRHASALPQMLIEERDIQSSPDALLNEALSARFQLTDRLRQVDPAVFTQAGALIRDDITFPSLGDLLRKTAMLTPDSTWARIDTGEITAAEQTVTQRYEALSFGVVAAAGLLDGVNPCAFATIIFLLSYLQVARRSPREILAVGAAFDLCSVPGVFRSRPRACTVAHPTLGTGARGNSAELPSRRIRLHGGDVLFP